MYRLCRYKNIYGSVKIKVFAMTLFFMLLCGCGNEKDKDSAAEVIVRDETATDSHVDFARLKEAMAAKGIPARL